MSSKLHLSLAISGLLLMLPTLSRAQQAQPTDTPTYTLQVNAREVVLDVVVHDSKGHPVSGLKPSDFSVVEDNVPQTVRDVTEHVPQPPAPSTIFDTKQQPNIFRNISLPTTATSNAATVILIDALETPTVAQMYVRQQLMSFFRKMPPGYVFAIFQLDTQLHLIQGFSADPKTLYAAVEGKRDMPDLPIGMSKIHRKQVLDQAMYAMGRYLEAFPGRKNIIWFTSAVPGKISGLKDNPFPDAVDFDHRFGRPGNVQSLSRIAVYPIDGKGLTMRGGFGEATTHEDMDRAAERTGGEAYHNTNGLDHALSEITETSSDYYTLAYAPTNTDFNAHSRKVRIVVNRPKLTVLYRHSYYGHKGHPRQAANRTATPQAYITPASPAAESASASDADPELRPAFNAAMDLGSVPSGELLFQVTVLPDAQITKLRPGEPLPPQNFMVADYVRKPFRNYELRYRVDRDKLRPSGPPASIRKAELLYAAVVYTQEGQVVNSLVSQNTLKISSDASSESSAGSNTVDITQEIAVPEKGIYFLRLGVQDLSGNLIGSMEIPLDAIAKDVTPPTP